jgi:hypothetical protein
MLLLVSPDGDWVTDAHNLTFDEAQQASENMGSRWFFYPCHFIIKDTQELNRRNRIIESPDLFPSLKNKSIGNILNIFKHEFEKNSSWLNFE